MIEGMAVRKRAEVPVRLHGVAGLGFFCHVVFWEFSSCIRVITYCFSPLLFLILRLFAFLFFFWIGSALTVARTHPLLPFFQYTTVWRFPWISMASMGKAPAIHGSLFSTIHMQYESHVSRFMQISSCIRSLGPAPYVYQVVLVYFSS